MTSIPRRNVSPRVDPPAAGQPRADDRLASAIAPRFADPRRSAARVVTAVGLIFALAACVGGPGSTASQPGGTEVTPAASGDAGSGVVPSGSATTTSPPASSPPSTVPGPTPRPTVVPSTPKPTIRPVAGADLIGRVTAGPTCPVMRVPPDPACADRPVAGAVLVITDDAGREVARLTSDANGDFSAVLPSGHYVLTPQPVEGLMGTAAPADFTAVSSGPVVTLAISYDTGIR